MDSLLFPSIFILLASFLLPAVVKIIGKMKTIDSNTKLPPGPWKLPIIGNLHQLVKFGSQPHQILRDLANQHGPLMHLQLGELSNVVVSSAEMAKDVLITNGVVFAGRPYVAAIDAVTYGSRDISMAPYGNYWRHVRKICTVELLTAKRVQSFESIRQEEVSALVKYMSSNQGSPVNLSQQIFSLTYRITSKAAFGNTSKGHESYSDVVDKLAKLGSGFRLADMYPSSRVLQHISGLKQEVRALFQKSDEILQGIINEHRTTLETAKTGEEEEAKEDLVTALLKIQQQGGLEFPLTDQEIKAIILDIFAGGGESSSTTVEWAMSEMVRNPRLLKRAQNEVRQICREKGYVDEASIKELKYLALVIKETLRLHPPFPLLLPRESREDCEVNGYRIPSKTKVIINAWAVGRDPKFWSEAETFHPERFSNNSIDFKGTDLNFIPFGAGRRMCPGISFALPNVELPLAKLLFHFDWKLPNEMKNENLDMTEDFGVTMSRKNNLILVPTECTLV
ncbi:Cytochrome P450 71D10 [Hibiscus syriacus]|uniref:Cytochrome P450 71D10 n=1 Tax=Hibiscus syriacus TaxID=106335 RepID=A0A6A3AT60_HIBSY|nr:cytochrome P450 71D10-like [Hibiscus syriacus]KAE8707854.1 Cytochrome P450 71D10 [Hibiscus syriacus]